MPMPHALTIDVEDWFQVQAYADVVSREDWDGLPRRVEANTDRLLALFAEAGVTATFFTLGWVAERHPALIRRIVAGGHELASHGYWHRLVHTETPDDFRQDVSRARAILEDTGQVAVRGYRAPTFSIGNRNEWAFEVLGETGHVYSSSTFPVRHDLYGDPDAPRHPHRRRGLLEIPMTTLRLGGRNLPVSGGGYFRLAPYPLFRRAFARATAAADGPGVFYSHPWEIDPDQPRVPAAPALSQFRHRVNLQATAGRLRRLLRDFAWSRMDRAFGVMP